MGIPSGKVAKTKKTSKTQQKMKHQQQQVSAKKKKSVQKQLQDSISETISFVIKGKLTPIKPAAVKKCATKKEKKPPLVKKTLEVFKEEPPKIKEETKTSKQQKFGKAKKEEPTKTGKKVTAGSKLKKKSAAAVIDKKETKQPSKKAKKLPAQSKSEETPEGAARTKAAPIKKIQAGSKIKQNKVTAKVKAATAKKVISSRKVNKTKVRTKNAPKQVKGAVKSEEVLNADDTSSTSDEITLDLLRKKEGAVKQDAQTSKIKEEYSSSDSDGKTSKKKKIASKMTVLKKKLLAGGKDVVKRKGDQRRKLKLYSMWTGPKRHRVASLNALAKVHCLYENESRGNIIDSIEPVKKETQKKTVKIEEIKEEIPNTRILRTVPGLRGVGKHWDMHDTTSSSSEEEEESGSESSSEISEQPLKPRKESSAKRSEEKKAPVRKRKKNEIVMDLKDMVVRKRMASLNASAILAASYSLEKNSSKSPKNDSDSDDTSVESFSDDSDSKGKSVDDEVKKGEDDKKMIEVRTTPNKKVAVIVNQDTDVTITGVYVNSTTRSTHHEGYCSIAGMQYRISATSHTQTAATAVSTETLLQSTSSSSQENSNSESTPSKSYTPLDALSNMQPPNTAGPQHSVSLPHHHLGPPHISPQLSPLARRHGCSSAFSAPPGHYPPGHHHPPPPAMHNEQSYIHGYFQPAGPLITVPHGHTQQQPPPLGKSAPLSETPSVSPPMTHQPPAPSSAGDSSDNDVIITSVTSAKDASPPQPSSQPYRLSQYASAHSGYPYGYPPHYYHAPPPAPAYSHHDLCYSPNPYLHHKTYPPTAYRHRYLAAPPTAQYYPPNPTDLYNSPPTASQQNQQVITAAPAAAASANSYQPPPTGPPPPTLLDAYVPPPPTLVETYPPPPHYYSGYGPAPPSCYSHSPTRSLPYINATYQSCPCPMQSCPKNVHTGPLIGDNKRSNISSITKESVLLPPVALALPLEPASATGPPSPARGSAGMAPPPSPAGATYQAPPTPKHETSEPVDVKTIVKGRKARVGKSVVRNNLHAQNTMLLMCHEPVHNPCLGAVKREVESPKEEQQKKEAATPEDDIQSKVETSTVEEKKCPASIITLEKKQPEVVVQQVKQILKVEQSERETPNKEPPVNLPEVPETVEPCVKTVAENVKVKNMKRKLSMGSRADEVSPRKKLRQERSHLNGSYKDLIKKNFASVHINNGKRKLYDKSKTLVHRLSRFGLKRPTTKRKLSPIKEESRKRSKPLTASNLHNSKQNFKEIKEQSYAVDSELIENKEPTARKIIGKNAKVTSKKFAPAILDNLFAKNNVDRTIESVIIKSAPRVAKINLNRLRTSCGKTKVDARGGCKKISTNSKSAAVVKNKVECQKVGAAKRKSKCKSADVIPQAVAKVPRRSLHLPRWSNGWTWTGEPFEAKVFFNSDEATTLRKCYPAMRHEEGDIIEARDCVLLKAGQRKNELPFVAKIAALWENPDDGEMMMSLLWYYRPEHTEQGRLPCDQPDEVFASRHKDSNSVACIEDKCYVLTFNEYCRYRKNLRRLEEGIEDTTPCIPTAETYLRVNRQPPISIVTSADLVFFCRRVYDFRQKRIVKNPS